MERRQASAGRLFVLPALALIAVFFFVPVIVGLVLSLTDFDIYAIGDTSIARFVGLNNYVEVLRNPVFWKALGNTLYFVFVSGPLMMIVSLAAALLLNAKLARARGFFRTAYFLPVVTTIVAVSIVWRYLYHPHYGLLNFVLGKFGAGPIDWLGDPHWAMPAIIVLAVWKNFGYNMLIYLAGLQSIPEELYEAAHLDGAGWWGRFVNVTLPGLGPTMLFVSITTLLNQFQLFAEPYVMTQGGPLQSTMTLVLFLYEQGFRWWRMGMAAAIAFLLFVIMLTGTLIQLRLSRERAR
ncbi:MAG TPA: sugar ABC transporter permease [Candidatus Eisenbacteria bacterium]|nr:sugar ABC transporter permease [Candidatus Eisenbacteria bacterium]